MPLIHLPFEDILQTLHYSKVQWLCDVSVVGLEQPWLDLKSEIIHCKGNMRGCTIHGEDDWPIYMEFIYISNEVLKNEEKGVTSYKAIWSR